jgi:hypothetical protein
VLRVRVAELDLELRLMRTERDGLVMTERVKIARVKAKKDGLAMMERVKVA